MTTLLAPELLSIVKTKSALHAANLYLEGDYFLTPKECKIITKMVKEFKKGQAFELEIVDEYNLKPVKDSYGSINAQEIDKENRKDRDGLQLQTDKMLKVKAETTTYHFALFAYPPPEPEVESQGVSVEVA